MNRLAVIGLVGLAGCASNRALEQKVAGLEGELAATRKALEQRDDELAQQIASIARLEGKLGKLEKEQQALAAAAAARRDSAPPRPRRPEPDRALVYAMPDAGAPSDGPADAPVTIVIGYDYACPYCDKAQATLGDLRKKYGPKLRLVHQPLVVHPRTAMAPALAACAASRQGRFAPMDELLWGAFHQRSFDPDRCWEAQGCPLMEGFAGQLGLEPTKFKADMLACKADVAASGAAFSTFGVAATPAFFINGRYLVGAQPIESFAALIDEELAKAEARIRAGTPRKRYYQKWVLEAGLKRLEPEAPAAIATPPAAP